jgi:hypothetical protein
MLRMKVVMKTNVSLQTESQCVTRGMFENGKYDLSY